MIIHLHGNQHQIRWYWLFYSSKAPELMKLDVVAGYSMMVIVWTQKTPAKGVWIWPLGHQFRAQRLVVLVQQLEKHWILGRTWPVVDYILIVHVRKEVHHLVGVCPLILLWVFLLVFISVLFCSVINSCSKVEISYHNKQLKYIWNRHIFICLDVDCNQLNPQLGQAGPQESISHVIRNKRWWWINNSCCRGGLQSSSCKRQK